MIPKFDETGTLPVGIHDCTLKELEEHLGYNMHRRHLIENLKCIIPYFKSVACPAIYVDGSFTTSKTLPNDIDLLWDEGTGSDYKFERQNAPILFDKRFLKDKYKIDLYPAAIQEGLTQKWFIDFFQSTLDGQRKGILRIIL